MSSENQVIAALLDALRKEGEEYRVNSRKILKEMPGIQDDELAAFHHALRQDMQSYMLMAIGQINGMICDKLATTIEAITSGMPAQITTTGGKAQTVLPPLANRNREAAQKLKTAAVNSVVDTLENPTASVTAEPSELDRVMAEYIEDASNRMTNLNERG